MTTGTHEVGRHDDGTPCPSLSPSQEVVELRGQPTLKDLNKAGTRHGGREETYISRSRIVY